jgi:hypothetical protein
MVTRRNEMRRTFASFLILLVLCGHAASAPTGKIIDLKQPIIGCLHKADLGHFPPGLQKGISRIDMPRAYRQRRCVRLPRGSARISRVEGTYACLRFARHSCWWVRSEEIGVPIIGDMPFEPKTDGPVRVSPPGHLY